MRSRASDACASKPSLGFCVALWRAANRYGNVEFFILSQIFFDFKCNSTGVELNPELVFSDPSSSHITCTVCPGTSEGSLNIKKLKIYFPSRCGAFLSSSVSSCVKCCFFIIFHPNSHPHYGTDLFTDNVVLASQFFVGCCHCRIYKFHVKC